MRPFATSYIYSLDVAHSTVPYLVALTGILTRGQYVIFGTRMPVIFMKGIELRKHVAATVYMVTELTRDEMYVCRM